jgi:hypothetical protein
MRKSIISFNKLIENYRICIPIYCNLLGMEVRKEKKIMEIILQLRDSIILKKLILNYLCYKIIMPMISKNLNQKSKRFNFTSKK